MSDLDPDPLSPGLVLEDPSITRLMPRSVVGRRSAALLEHCTDVATSVSVVLAADALHDAPGVDALADWTPGSLRVEVLLVDDGRDTRRALLRERLSRSTHVVRTVERSAGGRAAALSAAAVAADHEFLVVGALGRPPLGVVPAALSLMWAEGADAAVVDHGDGQAAGLDPDRVDPSGVLANRLGLAGHQVDGGLVVLRRWAARWLLNEITRAISPGEELADRARLLGIGILALTADR